MAGKMLDESEQRELVGGFEMVEREIGLDIYQRFE
jgi:hypothetical protein